jgi:hypothetical protein
VSIRVRGSDRVGDDLGSFGLEHRVEGGGELGVAVVDQEPRHCPVFLEMPARVPGLLREAESGLAVLPAMWTLLVLNSMKNRT